ncbi:MAG: prolyl oligopeptidase family serine peptidase [Flavisolibacter sp.]|nr:prolyl oligopeptidase family serine peptidase [Flavisolibacter sp.]MBD0377550.1 prolyl oligopeptidase family serine peptidase [Flavisolibacter sp.]
MVVETDYLLYLPDHYQDDTTKRWPLLLFLHGSGESGHDIQKVKVHGPPKLIEGGKRFPFLVVSPQSDVPSGWDVENLHKLLQVVKKTYRVDYDRIYVTGLSMGGFGTWALAMKYPDEFAAIAPVCGGGDTANAWKLRNIPVWCFHGALDNVVPVAGSENMVKATARLNPAVRFTVYPDKNHNSWDTTYNTSDSLYNWLLAQKKFRYKEVTVNPAVLKKYEGKYVGPDNDTVKIIASEKGLTAIPGKDTVLLKIAGENLFFLHPEKNMDIRFVGTGKMITSFWFMGDRKLFYRRMK